MGVPGILTRIQGNRRVDGRKGVRAGRRQERDQCRHLFLVALKLEYELGLAVNGVGNELSVLRGDGNVLGLHGVEQLGVFGLIHLVGVEVEIRVPGDLSRVRVLRQSYRPP